MKKSILKGLLGIAVVITMLFSPFISSGAEKKPKKPPVAIQDTTINDANLSASVKRADELLKNKDLDSSLRIYLKAYNYTKEVLTTVKLIQPYYDKALSDPSTAQSDKEQIIVKQKHIKQIVPRYSGIKDAVSYNLGYIYAKKGDSEKARKYLSEVLETTPFSMKKDDLWMKTKTLLLSQYGLEGEF